MKRFFIHTGLLGCLLALSVLLPCGALAAEAEVETLDTLTVKKPTDGKAVEYTNPMEIKPASSNIGIVDVEKDAVAYFKGVLSGKDMNLAKMGLGDMHLDAANTYTGNTYIYQGTLLVANDSALGNGGGVIVNGGTFRAKGTFETDRTFTLGSSGGNFEVANSSTLTLKGQVTGTGSLTMVQNGVLVLANAKNDYSGGTIIHTGTVKLTDAKAAGSGPITLVSNKSYNSYPGTLDISLGADGTISNPIYVVAADTDRVGAKIVKNENNKVTLSGAMVQSNSLDVKAGDLTVSNTLESPTIDIAKGSNLTVGTLRLAGATDQKINNQGTFTYSRLQVVGGGNKVASSALPSVAGKQLSFVFDDTTTAGTPMLAVTGNSLNVAGSTVALSASTDLNKLNVGDKVTLIDKTSGAIANSGQSQTFEGGAHTYTFTTAQGTIDPNSTAVPTDAPLTATLQDAKMTGGKSGAAKAYLESALAGLQTVSGANQFMGTVGIREAVKSSLEHDERNDLTASVAFRGTYQEVDTGSSIKGWTYNLLGSMTYKMRNSLGLTRLGPFIEGGWGRFDTKNRFSGRTVEGDSDISYAGAGMLLRHDLPIGIYGEGTFRVGRVDGDFGSGDMGAGAAYESSMMYYGGHLGLGYIHHFSEKHELDLFAKVFWTRTEDDSVKTDAGEYLDIDSADSIVSHLGARYSAVLPWNLVFHVAGGWEHEFDGEQTGKLNGRRVNNPDMGGSSGVGEIGIRWTPPQTGFYVDLAAHGSGGQRDSVGGNINLGYEF